LKRGSKQIGSLSLEGVHLEGKKGGREEEDAKQDRSQKIHKEKR